MDFENLSIKQREQLKGYINDGKISQANEKGYFSTWLSFIKSYLVKFT